MKKTPIVLTILLFTMVLVTFENCSNQPGYKEESAAVSAPMPCLAPPSWFPHAQTPTPEEGSNSNFANPNSTTNCDFHLWSWQKFLYLTQTDANGKARFENLVQVTNQMVPRGNTLILDDSSQAGTKSVLRDKNNRAVYYAIYMNQTMYDFSNQYVSLFKTNCDSSGILSNTKLKQFGYDTITYPIGSFEIKTAWMLASSLPPGDSTFYYTTAMIYNQPTNVALVGMHIVGRVINHPELVWATYEHLKAAPIAQWPANILTDSTPDPHQVLSNTDYLFYNAGLPMDSCNINSQPATFKSIYHLFENGTQPIYSGITEAARKQDSTNLINIKSINASVLNELNNESGPWKNYSYFGSIWIDPTTATLQPGDGKIGALNRANLRGSRALSNICAETYIQAISNPPFPYRSFNCFGCHGTANNKAGYDLALSHLFNNSLNDSMGGEKEQMRINMEVNAP